MRRVMKHAREEAAPATLRELQRTMRMLVRCARTSTGLLLVLLDPGHTDKDFFYSVLLLVLALAALGYCAVKLAPFVRRTVVDREGIHVGRATHSWPGSRSGLYVAGDRVVLVHPDGYAIPLPGTGGARGGFVRREMRATAQCEEIWRWGTANGATRESGRYIPLRFADWQREREVFEARARDTGLASFDVAWYNDLLRDYRDALGRLRTALTGELLDVVIARRDHVLDEAGTRAEELREAISHRKGSLSIRDLMGTYGDLVTAITPCILVSPDSVARFLPVRSRCTDIVVFDEASQITVPDAVGAMGRGRSTVVVGDIRQMPPAVPSGAGGSSAPSIELSK